jgi:hypothetical protein
MHILQLILQAGAYSDLMKIFLSSFKPPMIMSVMISILTVTILFSTFPPLILQLLFGGCRASGGVLGFESHTRHMTGSVIYIPDLYMSLHQFNHTQSSDYNTDRTEHN